MSTILQPTTPQNSTMYRWKGDTRMSRDNEPKPQVPQNPDEEQNTRQ